MPIIHSIIKNGGHRSYKHLKRKLRVFLTGYTVAIITSDAMKTTTTCWAMIGYLFDIIIVAATDKDL